MHMNGHFSTAVAVDLNGTVSYISEFPQADYEDEVIVFDNDKEPAIYSMLSAMRPLLGELCAEPIRRGRSRGDAIRGKDIRKFGLRRHRLLSGASSAAASGIGTDKMGSRRIISQFNRVPAIDEDRHKPQGQEFGPDHRHQILQPSIQRNFDRTTIHSSNMYQIFAYVKNKDTASNGHVSGLLLYARTDEEIRPDLDAKFGANRIRARTLDLNCEFSEIRKQLDFIAAELYE